MAHSLVIGASSTNKVDGKKANVMVAAHYASQAALRLLKAGNEVGLACFYLCNTFKLQMLIICTFPPRRTPSQMQCRKFVRHINANQ